ncbi:hypothetical protein [Streptomyces anulatus]|uniref:hypothetical protein n=1 Tax=Streptomyces anulatus TaxID=1892 RepID=UPI0036CDDA9C
MRERPFGAVDFLGWVDHQAKIRGLRVGPSDVEHALLLRPEVVQAAVAAVEDARRGGTHPPRSPTW